MSESKEVIVLDESCVMNESCASGDSNETTNISEDKLIRTLEIIQSSSVRTKEIYKGLTYIRTKIVDNPEGVSLLIKVNGFKCLLKILNNNNEDILNVTMSILGNLCNHLIMNEEFREEIVKSKISERIVEILRGAKKVSIQKRVCRFMGNLAQAHVIAQQLHNASAAHALVTVLNGSEDTEVQHMGIRALRWLWEVDKHHINMLKTGVVKAVSSHIASKDPYVEKAVFRALVKFTQHCTVYTAEQISGTGNGYKVIVEKLDLPVVPVLICNLSYDPRARIELCKAGAVEAIINRLEEGKMNSYLITGLCQMCRESMVRASLRVTPNGFKTLLSLLSNKKTKHFYPEILDAITQFNYDQTSLMLMVRLGLIGVLIEKLGEYTKAHCCAHSEAVAAESMGPVSPLSPTWSWAASPSPPPLSPPSRNASNPDYSPRCSTPTSDSEGSSPIPPLEKSYSDTPVGLDGCILEVLMQLTYQGTPMRAMPSKTTISTLLDYLTGLPYPRYRNNFVKASRALTAIVTCKHYWNTLLDDESVLHIHGKLCRAIHEDCWECKRLQDTGKKVLQEIGLTAQSGLGEGEITYRLMGVSPAARLTTALTIPHVIREHPCLTTLSRLVQSGRSWSRIPRRLLDKAADADRQPNLLQNLLFNHNALRILLDALSSRIDEAVPAIHSLFSTLAIKNPQLPIQMCSSCEIGSIRKEGNIRFTLDDGSTVSANKESLSHSCPVFEAMFRGGFKESLQSSVRLSDISADCLSHLTRILPEYCSCALPKDLPILLEMISATDRFLLPALTEKVVQVVRDSALSYRTASVIYNWGLTSGQHYEVSLTLAEDVVKFIFASEINEAQRIFAASNILESENKQKFLEDIDALVRRGVAYAVTRRKVGLIIKDEKEPDPEHVRKCIRNQNVVQANHWYIEEIKEIRKDKRGKRNWLLIYNVPVSVLAILKKQNWFIYYQLGQIKVFVPKERKRRSKKRGGKEEV